MEIWQQTIANCSIPPYARDRLLLLVGRHGYSWLTELSNSDIRKGSGVTIRRYTFSIGPEDDNSIQEDSESVKFVSQDEDGLKDWLMEIESLFDDDEGSESPRSPFHKDQWSPFDETLRTWIKYRIDYFRSIKNMKTTDARVLSYEEVEQVPLGGEELFCVYCGALFWDNYRRLKAEERHYCSISCQEKVQKDCVNCGERYTVGRAKLGWRNTYRLSGFCTQECHSEGMEKRRIDDRYLRGVIQRLEIHGAEVDETVTRRAVFEKFGGICYLCKKQTNWTMQGFWDPLLANVEHVFPVVHGGSHTWNNVALSCALCNSKKGSR